jgi:putative ubiquitin-RnfH superfamily antitoxin RatB of RatAB toxin-antitoxin module
MSRARDKGETVEVVYATAEAQRIIEVSFSAGLTAEQAVERAGFLDDFPEIQSNSLVLGIFGERVAGDRELAPGERVEICRPLKQDPRDMRSSLAASGGVMGRPKDG